MVLMQHVEMATETIARVAALGVELYIDDFGTGYSSLHCTISRDCR